MTDISKKAADAVGVTPCSDMRPFVERAVIWAIEEIKVQVRQSLIDAAHEHRNDTAACHTFWVAELVVRNSIDKNLPEQAEDQ